ncbi:hypothetical protein ACLB2K_049031 [Fragaria x ananassa]
MDSYTWKHMYRLGMLLPPAAIAFMPFFAISEIPSFLCSGSSPLHKNFLSFRILGMMAMDSCKIYLSGLKALLLRRSRDRGRRHDSRRTHPASLPGNSHREGEYQRACVRGGGACSYSTLDAAVWGLKCISQLLTVILTSNMDSAALSHVSYLYQLLLGFATTRINHVRKPSHVVIAEVMQSLQGTADIVHASEALVNFFERWWLPLLGGNGPSVLSNEAEPIESWFCLDVMKRCVVLMPTKFKLTMLNCFKTILELALHRNPITILVEWILERFCLHPSAPKDVPPHLLLDLLCLILVSVTKRVVFDREGATTASILENGVNSLLLQQGNLCDQTSTCVRGLKVLMRIPADQVDDGHIEEDIYAAAQAFKHLIHACIDKGLVNQGLDQINTIANSKSEPPQPKELTVIEKLCATIEGLLGYHRTGAHALSMDCAFDVVLTMFDKLGACSCYFMRGTLESLADMHKFADEQFPYRKQATLLLGRLVEEKFGADDANIRAVLTREELMGLLADYRDLKSKQLAQLSHLKRKGPSIEHILGHCGPSSIRAKAATARAICSTEKMTKKIKL